MVRFMANSINPINLENLKRLGIDEISLVKGQGKFIVVLWYLDQHKLIRLFSARTQREIRKVMEYWGQKESVINIVNLFTKRMVILMQHRHCRGSRDERTMHP